MRQLSKYVFWIGFSLLLISNRALCFNIDSLKEVISNTTDLEILMVAHQAASNYYYHEKQEELEMYHARILFNYYVAGKVDSINYYVLYSLINYHFVHKNADSGLYLMPIIRQKLIERGATQLTQLEIILMEADFLQMKEDFNHSLYIMDSIELVLEKVDSSDDFRSRLNWSIGGIYNVTGEIEKSLTYYLKALKHYEEVNSPRVSGLIYNTAMIYYRLKEWDKAEELFIKSMKINKREKHDYWLGHDYNALGEVVQEMSEYSRAYNYFKLAENQFDSLESPADVALIHVSIGNLYLAMAKDTSNTKFTINEVEISQFNLVDSAAKYYKSGLQTAEKHKSDYVIRFAYRGMGLVLVKANEFESAIHYLSLWEEMVVKVGDQIAMSESKKELATTYFKEAIRLMKLGKMKEANDHLLISIKKRAEYQALDDSIFSNKKIRDLSNKQREFDLGQKDRETDMEAARVKGIEEERRNNLQVIIYTTIGGLMLVMAFLFVLYKRFKVTKKLNVVIGDQKAELETSHDELKKTSSELVTSHEELKKTADSVNSSIMYASRIQNSILTSDSYLTNMFNEHFVFYKPRDIVSGDYYWAYESKSGNKIWAVVDCTGHGVPGGFMSMIGNTLLNEIIVERGIENPGEILDELRTGVIKTLDQTEKPDSNTDGMTIGICVYNPDTLTILYAGSETPLYIIRDKNIIEHEGDWEAISLASKMNSFQTTVVSVLSGDWIYFTTDGFPDLRGGTKGKKYMYPRFREQLIMLADQPVEQQLKLLEKEYADWVGSQKQVDDICVMGVKV